MRFFILILGLWQMLMAWTQPKTWSNEPLVAGDMNTHLRDNLEALKDPPSYNYESDEGADYATSSTSFIEVDPTNYVASITTNGGDVMVGFAATVVGTGGGNRVYLNLEVDSVLVAGNDGIVLVGADVPNDKYCISLAPYLITGIDPGNHVIKLMWKVNSGTFTMYAGAGTSAADVHPQFWVREVS